MAKLFANNGDPDHTPQNADLGLHCLLPITLLTLKAPVTTIVVCFVLPVTLKVISANSVDLDQTAPLGAV